MEASKERDCHFQKHVQSNNQEVKHLGNHGCFQEKAEIPSCFKMKFAYFSLIMASATVVACLGTLLSQ